MKIAQNIINFFVYVFYIYLGTIQYQFIFLLKRDIDILLHKENIILTISFIFAFIFLIRTKNGNNFIKKSNKNEVNENDVQKVYDYKLSSSPLIHINLMPSNGCCRCKISELPLRSHHCNKCHKCIRTFDHHCFYISCCIGEDNRLDFHIFLFFEIFCLIFTTFFIIKEFAFDIATFEIEVSMSLKIYIFSYLLFIILFSIMLLVFYFFQIYLFITNQTTFEVYNKMECPYIALFKLERKKIFKERGIEYKNDFLLLPFYLGVRKNIKILIYKFLHKNKPQDWEKIYFENIKSNKVYLKCI